MKFSRQEYWSGYPFFYLGYLPNSWVHPWSPTLQVDSLPSEPPGKPQDVSNSWYFWRVLEFIKYFSEDYFIYTPHNIPKGEIGPREEKCLAQGHVTNVKWQMQRLRHNWEHLWALRCTRVHTRTCTCTCTDGLAWVRSSPHFTPHQFRHRHLSECTSNEPLYWHNWKVFLNYMKVLTKLQKGYMVRLFSALGDIISSLGNRLWRWNQTEVSNDRY